MGIARDTLERADALVDAHVDVLVVDTAHGHSQGVLDIVQTLRRTFKDVDIIAGNVATAEATEALIDRGVDAVKVGIGAGSICTTRIVAGIGVPMITAVHECAQAASRHDVPVIADGGIRISGDVVKALAVGASAVMIGQPVRGHRREPGRDDPVSGPHVQGVSRHGLDRRDAQRQSRSLLPGRLRDSRAAPARRARACRRSSCRKASKAACSTRAASRWSIHQLVGGLRAGMGYCGAPTIPDLQRDAQFIRITQAGFRESHVHDVTITKEAPNYRSE